MQSDYVITYPTEGGLTDTYFTVFMIFEMSCQIFRKKEYRLSIMYFEVEIEKIMI